MNVKIEPSWKNILNDYFISKDFVKLTNIIKNEYLTKIIYPLPENIFKAFWLTPFSHLKVVILGQDPYHGKNQAHGLSFSVPKNLSLPPSLKNIYKEIESELLIKKDFSNGNLEDWAKQGVFLLNSILTVVSNSPASHKNIGWENFTDCVIKKISDQKKSVVFMLWGNFAKTKKKLINKNNHLVLESSHPSPFSVHSGFFGCNHFIKCNQYLEEKGMSSIRW